MSSKVRLAQRAVAMPASPIRRLAPFAVEARRAGKKVYGLNIGQPDIAAPPQILDRLKSFDETNVAYGPSQGLPEFVEALQGYHRDIGFELAPEEIFVTTGGSEALMFTIAAIADPGDEVIVFEPFYTNYSGFSELVSVTTVPVTTYAEDGFHLPDRARIEAKIGPKTRAIMLCSPNNPTGTVYADEEMELIGDLCRKHGLFLISDEVYREFCYDGTKHRSALTLAGLEDRVIVTDSLSKRVSLCGARVGWVVSRNRELMANLLKFGQARLCPPTLGQYIGVGMRDVPKSYIDGVIQEYERRRNCVLEALGKIPGATVRAPEGAFYVCPKLPIDDCQSFAEFLLRDFEIDGETVMLAPADGFYATPGSGKDEVRIAYVLNEEALRASMNILSHAVAAYAGRGATEQ